MWEITELKLITNTPKKAQKQEFAKQKSTVDSSEDVEERKGVQFDDSITEMVLLWTVQLKSNEQESGGIAFIQYN